MPRIDVPIPAINATRCHRGSLGSGQAMAPRKNTLTIETK